MEFRYDYQSPVGTLHLSADEHAVTRLSFSKTEVISGEPSKEYGSNTIISRCISQLDNYFSGKDLKFDIPTDQAGTAFQRSVWEALQTIGEGQTISYMELSKKLGNVKAIRAVGTANGRNNIAIIVPCHRVIGSGGDLVGYAGEIWRKKWLLEHEARFCHGVQKLF